jgi:mono/diheme cytochrome c family protein
MKRRMPSASKMMSAVVSSLAAGATGALLSGTAPARAADGKLDRGEYLVLTSGCHDCHTPMMVGKDGPEPDMSRMLSGHPQSLQMPPAPALPEGPWLVVASATNTAWAGPWGVSFTANLTPDADTGLGQWTQANFTNALRTGRHMGRGRPILPPMPIPAYKNLNDQDLEAIYTYLRSIPPVRNQVPEPLIAPMATAMGNK